MVSYKAGNPQYVIQLRHTIWFPVNRKPREAFSVTAVVC